MEITNFSDLLEAASAQPRAQRMLFVFLKTSSQKDYSPEQLAGFEAGEGGSLQPLFCVDLSPGEVESFEKLVAQADQQSADWDKVLVACMDEGAGTPGGNGQVEDALKNMVAKVESGEDLSAFLCFTRDEQAILFG